MGLEAGTLIPDLDANNPLGSDAKSEGDDHLRLIKRCTLGSFPGFVGTTATPKSVTLSEDQINDAALKSATQTIAGAWTFSAADTRFEGNIILMPTGSALQTRNLADTGDIPIVARNGSGDDLLYGSSTLVTAHQHFASNNEGHRFFSAGLEGLRAAVPAEGGAKVSDIGGTFKKAGFRNPASINLGSNFTIRQEDEGRILYVVTFNLTITAPQLEIGTCVRITTTNASTVNINLIEGAGVTIIADLGGAEQVGSVAIAQSSVIELYWRTATEVRVFGNGIS